MADGSGLLSRVRLPHDVGSVPRARQAAREALGDVEPSLLETISLLVSELTSNAVMHTDGGFTLSVARHGSRVRIGVTDCSSVLPRVLPDVPGRLGGWGLRAVAALAARWGVERAPPGKTVWCEVDTATDGAGGHR